MRKCLLLILLIATAYVHGQNSAPDTIIEDARKKSIDSLQHLFPQQKTDTGKARILYKLGFYYREINKDSCLKYLEQALLLSQQIKDFTGQAKTVRLMVDFLSVSGDYTRALEVALYNLQIMEKSKDTMSLFWTSRAVWRCYSYMLEHATVLEYARKTKLIVHSGYFKNQKDEKFYALAGYIHAMAVAHDGLNNLDSALYYGQMAYETARSINDTGMIAIAAINLGDFHRKRGNQKVAFSFYRMCISYAIKVSRDDLVAGAHLGMARLFAVMKNIDSALYYGHSSLVIYKSIKSSIHELLAVTFLSEVYAKENRIDSAYKYQSSMLALKDSLFNYEKTRQVKNIGFNEQLRLQQLEQQRKEVQQQYNMQLRTLGIVGGLILLLSIAFFMYRLRQIKHESNLKSGFTKKIQQVEMKALRAQMNPHFIFNCLNSINRYIVKSDHKTASGYLTKFSRLIRLILDNSANDIVSLEKEIETLQLYIEMEVLRFDHAFDYVIDVEENIYPESIFIPSMLLQPYVENAIWHGLLHKESGGGKLWIRFRQPAPHILIAEVEDNGIGREQAKAFKSKEGIKNKSYGMQISKDRILLFNELYSTNATVDVEDLRGEQSELTGTKVTLEIPVKYQ